MSQNQNEQSPDDLLERSLGELRHEALPDGPPEALVTSTLEALRSADTGPADSPAGTYKLQTQGNSKMKWITKLAAVIALVSAVACMVFLSNKTSSMAFADIVKKVREARTLSYTATTPNPEDPTKVITMKLFLNDNGRQRVETGWGHVMISDTGAGKMLMLDVSSKQATVSQFGGVARTPGIWIDRIKKLDEKNAKSLGEKEIDGHKTKGFLVEKEGTLFKVWADVDTKDPVQMEVDLVEEGEAMTFVMKDFVFDAKYDDALFSLEPPAGYAIRKLDLTNAMASAQGKTGEQHVITLLKFYTDRSDGKFPIKFDDWSAYGKLIGSAKPAIDEASATEFGASLGSVTPFLMTLGKGNWGYTGNGVKLDEKDKLVFWYLDKKTNKHRGIFGDLEARELSKQEVEEASAAAAPKVNP